MTFFSKFARTFSNTSDIFASYNCVSDQNSVAGQNSVADWGLLNGQILFNAFSPQPSRSAMPQGGILTKAELQRIVADMVG